MKMTEFTEIGTLLIQIDMKQRQLERLFPQKKSKLAKVYRDQCKLLEGLGICAWIELFNSILERYLCDAIFATTEELEAEARSQKRMELTDIGILLIQIDMEENQLKEHLEEAEAYRDERKRFKKLANHALQELDDLIIRRCKFVSIRSPLHAVTKELEAEANSKGVESDSASDAAETSNSRGQQ